MEEQTVNGVEVYLRQMSIYVDDALNDNAEDVRMFHRGIGRRGRGGRGCLESLVFC